MEDHRLAAARVDGGEPGQRIVTGAGHALARMLVGLADVDQDGALVDAGAWRAAASMVGRDMIGSFPAPGQSWQ